MKLLLRYMVIFCKYAILSEAAWAALMMALLIKLGFDLINAVATTVIVMAVVEMATDFFFRGDENAQEAS